MKKKGFTLIELLAVILILGIIALIAIPTVSNLIKESKKGAFKSSVQNLIRAAEQQCQLEQIQGDDITTVYTFTDGNVDNKLDVKGSLPKTGTITVDSGCNIAVNVSDGEFTATKNANSDTIEISVVDNSISYICKKATVLHQDGDITYGKLVDDGMLLYGDAFDCDVDGDGDYDPETERFYYVSDLYDTENNTFNEDYAVLIYYTNTYEGSPDLELDNIINYDSTEEYIKGPYAAILGLPTTGDWKNVRLKEYERKIIAVNAQTGVISSAEPETFSYEGYAARLITYQEIEESCSTLGQTNGLESCNYLLENTMYSHSNIAAEGYWLENPAIDSYGWSLNGGMLDILVSSISGDDVTGVRPVIEVLKTDMSY